MSCYLSHYICCLALPSCQVEDVDAKFMELEKLKSANWVIAKPSPVKRKVVKVLLLLLVHAIDL
jgi:hypothetical protein